MKYDSNEGSTICVTDDKGKKKTVDFASGCTVTVNGELLSIGALKEGDELAITGDPATAIVATRAEAKAVKEKAVEKPKEEEDDKPAKHEPAHKPAAHKPEHKPHKHH